MLIKRHRRDLRQASQHELSCPVDLWIRNTSSMGCSPPDQLIFMMLINIRVQWINPAISNTLFQNLPMHQWASHPNSSKKSLFHHIHVDFAQELQSQHCPCRQNHSWRRSMIQTWFQHLVGDQTIPWMQRYRWTALPPPLQQLPAFHWISAVEVMRYMGHGLYASCHLYVAAELHNLFFWCDR